MDRFSKEEIIKLQLLVHVTRKDIPAIRFLKLGQTSIIQVGDIKETFDYDCICDDILYFQGCVTPEGIKWTIRFGKRKT